jgi:hypothetical protein
MINYVKYAFYTLLLTSAVAGVIGLKNWHENDKAEAVAQAIEKIKSEQKTIVITQQDTVITQQASVFKKSQDIAKASIKTEKAIMSAVNINDKVSVKYNIIDEMNCVIVNFNDINICLVKPAQ